MSTSRRPLTRPAELRARRRLAPRGPWPRRASCLIMPSFAISVEYEDPAGCRAENMQAARCPPPADRRVVCSVARSLSCHFRVGSGERRSGGSSRGAAPTSDHGRSCRRAVATMACRRDVATDTAAASRRRSHPRARIRNTPPHTHTRSDLSRRRCRSRRHRRLRRRRLRCRTPRSSYSYLKRRGREGSARWHRQC